jgi:DNA-directed RNA polymerase subunit RPC12/RpoP
MTTTSEVKCPGCGKTGLTETLTIIDRRTGEEAMGRAYLVTGILLVALAALMLWGLIAYWNDPSQNEMRNYWWAPFVLLSTGGPVIYKKLREDRGEQMLYKCASCGRTFGEDDLVRASSSISSSS